MMRLLVSSLIVAMIAACSAKASPYKSISLCDFERKADPVAESPHYDIPTALKKPNYVNHDFRWGTVYAKMEPVDKEEAKLAKNKPFYKYFQGKTAARVKFTVPGDYKKKDPLDTAKAWETGLTLATDTYTALKVTDWTPWRYLDLDVYNPSERGQTLRLRVTDSSSKVTETSAVVVPGGPSTVEFDLKMLEDDRINAADIRSLTLYLDTRDQDKDPILVFDNLGLHTGTIEERRKAEATEEEAEEEEEDWDSEEEEEGKVKTGVVSRPSGVSGAMENLSQPAAVQP